MKRTWVKIFAGGLVASCILLVILRIALPGFIEGNINEALSKELNASASLGDLDLGVAAGMVTLNRLHIAQPPGYGDTSLLSAKRAAVEVSLGSLAGDTLQIEQVEIDDLTLHLVMNTNGVLNAMALMKEKPAAPGAAGDERSEEVNTAKALLVHALSARNLVVRYTDHHFGKPPLDVVLTNIVVSAEGLQLGDPDATGPPGACTLTAEIVQPTGKTARFGLNAKIGPLAGGIPNIVAGLRLVGLELVTIKPALLPGVPQVLGGNAVDIMADLSTGPQVLDGTVYIKTDKGAEYPILISGTPGHFEIDAGTLAGAVLKRPAKWIQSGLANASESAQRLAEGAADAGRQLVKGAEKTVKKFGTGLINAVRGLAAGDVKKAGQGLAEATVGAGTEAADSVGETAGTVSAGVHEAGATATGRDATKKWREEVPGRFDREFAEATKRVELMHWPPKPREP